MPKHKAKRKIKLTSNYAQLISDNANAIAKSKSQKQKVHINFTIIAIINTTC